MDELSKLTKVLLEQHGPMMTRAALYRALGFATYSAFNRALLRGDLGIEVFRIPGRKGMFALTTAVATWVETNSNPTDRHLTGETPMT